MPHTRSALSPIPARLRALSLAALSCTALLASPAALAADAKASQYYEDALTRFEKQDLAGAIIQLKNALQIDKTLLPVQMLLGRALLQNGEVAAAEVAFAEALRLGVNRAEVVTLLAQAYLAQGKQPQVLQDPLFATSGLPPQVQFQLWLLKAAASADTGDVRGALKAVDEARALDARSAAPWLAEAPIRIRAKQFKEAAAAAEQALALAPGSADAWYQKGAVAHVSGNLTAVLEAYAQALKLDPRHLEARVARAGLYLDLNRNAEAQADVDALLQQSPKEPRGAYLQALLAERQNQPERTQQALKEVTALLDPVPTDFLRYRPQLLMLNGLAHYGLGELEKAKQSLEAFHKNQGVTPAAKLLARIYLAEANSDRAIPLLESYLRASPQDGQAMMLLGSALMAKGQNARAASLMQQALQAQDRPEYRTALGLSLMRMGEAGAGLAELEAAYRKDPRQTPAAVALVGLYLRANQAAQAVPVAQALVQQQPGNAGFHNLLGMALGQSGQAPAARAAFEKSLALDPKAIQPRLNLARVDTATGNYAGAAARLQALLKDNDKNTEALGEMAKLALRQGQPAEAQRWLEKAAAVAGPKDPRWDLALADFHQRRGRVDAALAAVKNAAAKAPEDLGVLLAYARAQIATGDAAGAKSSLGTATRVAAFNPGPQVQVALLQMAIQNWPGAAYSLDKALSTSPDDLAAMALMAEVELRQGQPEKAEQRARAIVAKHPQRGAGPGLLGDVAQSRGQAAQALAFYRRAHELEPGTGSLVKLFGALSAQQGVKPALQLAEQWVKAHPKELTGLKLLANAHASAGQFAAAKTAYGNLLKLNPNDGDALNNLANVLLRLKDPEAIAVAEQAVAKDPANANALDTLGWALFQSGQTDRALQLLRDARLRQPGNPEIRYHLGAVLAKTGRNNEAREELEAALKGGQSFEGLPQAQALQKSLQP